MSGNNNNYGKIGSESHSGLSPPRNETNVKIRMQREYFPLIRFSCRIMDTL